MQFFLVNQSKNFERELADGVIWAAESTHHARRRIVNVKQNDVIFSVVDRKLVARAIALSEPENSHRKSIKGADQIGYLVRVAYERFAAPIALEVFETKLLQEIGGRKYSPFDKNGRLNQGYLYSLEPSEAQLIIIEIDQYKHR